MLHATKIFSRPCPEYSRAHCLTPPFVVILLGILSNIISSHGWSQRNSLIPLSIRTTQFSRTRMMEYPKLGEERYRSGRDKYYCAFHKVALQIQETPWQMPAYQNLIIQEEERGSSTVSKRVLYSEADIQAHFETLLDSILHKDGRFGASAPVEISRAENYWTSDSGESFAHFFANTRPDSVTQLLGRKLIVVEVKTPWPPLHRLSGLSCELRARLFGMS